MKRRAFLALPAAAVAVTALPALASAEADGLSRCREKFSRPPNTCRGQIVWLKDDRLEEVSRRLWIDAETSSTHCTQYDYYATFGLAFAESRMRSVRRIYAELKLIFDAGIAGKKGRIPGLTFRHNPDDAAWPSGSLVRQNAPVPRGVMVNYIVFERLPLLDFGNRIPTIDVDFERG